MSIPELKKIDAHIRRDGTSRGRISKSEMEEEGGGFNKIGQILPCRTTSSKPTSVSSRPS